MRSVRDGRAVTAVFRWWLTASLGFALAALVASCVSVLDLGDYEEGAQVLCDHLNRCFGAGAYQGCYEHVASGLDGGSAEERAAWLQGVTDAGCLAACTAGKSCLDAAPVCHEPGASCSQPEHCCGFTTALLECQEGRCCLPDGNACASDAECCTSCDSTTGTCGGAVECVKIGEDCSTTPCCSGNCSPDSNRCVEPCRALNEECSQNDQCCSGICEGTCVCREQGASCDGDQSCCQGLVCDPSSSRCAVPVDCTPLGDDCGTVATCCNDAATCAPTGCCLPAGALGCSVGGDSGCCPGTFCRLDLQDDAKTRCCAPAGCHRPCEVGAPLSPTNVAAGCQVEVVDAACIRAVCDDLPECCCVGWTQACVDLVAGLNACAAVTGC